jgi:toxin ParE1/3/4
MARYRLTKSARGDIDSILRASGERHGRDARARYGALLLAALRRVAADPEGRSTIDRSKLRRGVRSFHIRHSREESREAPVANPVHVVFYRVMGPGVVEIVRVLHDRMEPKRHIGVEDRDESDRDID